MKSLFEGKFYFVRDLKEGNYQPAKFKIINTIPYFLFADGYRMSVNSVYDYSDEPIKCPKNED